MWRFTAFVGAIVALSACTTTGIHQYILLRQQQAGTLSAPGEETRVVLAFVAICAKYGMTEIYDQRGHVLELLDTKAPAGIRAVLDYGPNGFTVTVVELDDRYPLLKSKIDALRADLESMLRHEVPGVNIDHQEYGPSPFS